MNASLWKTDFVKKMSANRDKENLLEGPAIIWTHSVHQIHFGSRKTAYWSIPAITYSSVQVSCVEILKTLEKRYPSLQSVSIYLFHTQ